jgi:hypothetical protein
VAATTIHDAEPRYDPAQVGVVALVLNRPLAGESAVCEAQLAIVAKAEATEELMSEVLVTRTASSTLTRLKPASQEQAITGLPKLIAESQPATLASCTMTLA